MNGRVLDSHTHSPTHPANRRLCKSSSTRGLHRSIAPPPPVLNQKRAVYYCLKCVCVRWAREGFLSVTHAALRSLKSVTVQGKFAVESAFKTIFKYITVLVRIR